MKQKDYLKKYLSPKKEKKRSQKKEKCSKGNLRIIDDTTEFEETGPNFDYSEDAPTIAELTYETDSTGKIASLSQKTDFSLKRNLTNLIEDRKGIEGDKEDMTVMKRRRLMKTKKITPEEEARKKREAVLQSVVDEKHNNWNMGVKQKERLIQQDHEDSYEASKEFARHASDEDLNSRLKNAAREEDPMLEYINRKKSEKLTEVMPSYKGSYPPNRFNIRPGYRWDGVDRSSGYEKRWFEKKSTNADDEDMYKWSLENL